MKKMGVNLEGFDDVTEVIIKREVTDLVIKKPEVSVMKVGDQQIFQITGQVSEVPVDASEFTEDDIQIVAEQAETTHEEAKNALSITEGDLAKAILHLQSQKNK
jgi:alpha-NAC-related protein